MTEETTVLFSFKAWRKRHRWTQAEAGKALGVRRETIIQWEKQQRVGKMVRLACWYLDSRYKVKL